jgi:hypothetical protein
VPLHLRNHVQPPVRRQDACVPLSHVGDGKATWMTFKIEFGSDGARSTIRLIGSVKLEHLREIAHQLEVCGTGAALDLEGITIVGVSVIHFLAEREQQGTELLNCPAYVREWISREGEQQ